MSLSPQADQGSAAFADAMRRAITDRGLPREELAEILRRRGHAVAFDRLEEWPGGYGSTSASAYAAVAELEEILEVPRGSLAPAAAPDAPPLQSDPVPRLAPFAADSALYDDLLAQVGRPRHPKIRVVATHDLIDVGPQREFHRHLVRQLVQSDDEGLDGASCWFQMEGPAQQPFVRPVTNCVLGEVVEIPEKSLVLVELRFLRPLARGESLVFEYLLDSGGRTPVLAYWERTVTVATRELHFDIRFDPAARPTRAELYTIHDGVTREWPVPLVDDLLSVTRFDVAPGVVGTRWSW